MLSAVIENLLRSIEPQNTTDIFIIVIMIFFVLSLYWTKKDTHHNFTEYAPTLLTSIGILGTFIGIVIGLLSFDTNNIDESISQLLDGLKIAFITSLVGMFFALLYKFLTTSNIVAAKVTQDIKDDIDVKDLYTVMVNQNDNLIKLQNLLSSDIDSSLVGQIKQMRSDINDNSKLSNKNLEEILEYSKKLSMLNNIYETIKFSNEYLKSIETNQIKQEKLFNDFSSELWIKLENFADILSKSATEQIIEALKNVISEFNEKLTEQFGQNFKELNDAVKDLVVWQDNYKTQLTEMKNQFDTSVSSMGEMEKSIESISINSKSIPDNMIQLESVMKINQHQIDELSNHLEAFKDIRDKAVEAVPEIRTQIDNTIEGISKASKDLIEGVTSSTDKISTVITQNADDFANNVSKTNGALVESSNTLTQSSNDIKEQLTLTIQDINKNVREMVENISKNGEDINNSFKDVNSTIQTELLNTNQKMVGNFNSSIDELRNLSKKISDSLSSVTSELESNIKNVSQKQLEETTKVLNGLDKSIEKTIQDTSNNISRQIETMDKITEQEIANVLNAMGKALGSIANQFTNDYQKLVQEMKKIVESHR